MQIKRKVIDASAAMILAYALTATIATIATTANACIRDTSCGYYGWTNLNSVEDCNRQLEWCNMINKCWTDFEPLFNNDAIMPKYSECIRNNSR